MNVDMRAILEAVTMFPLRYVPIGEVGQPVGAILSWDEIEPGNTFESTISAVRSTYKACAAEVCYGEMWIWARSKKNRSVKHVLIPCRPDDSVGGNFSAECPPDGELCIFSYVEVSEPIGFSIDAQPSRERV